MNRLHQEPALWRGSGGGGAGLCAQLTGVWGQAGVDLKDRSLLSRAVGRGPAWYERGSNSGGPQRVQQGVLSGAVTTGLGSGWCPPFVLISMGPDIICTDPSSAQTSGRFCSDNQEDGHSLAPRSLWSRENPSKRPSWVRLGPPGAGPSAVKQGAAHSPGVCRACGHLPGARHLPFLPSENGAGDCHSPLTSEAVFLTGGDSSHGRPNPASNHCGSAWPC